MFEGFTSYYDDLILLRSGVIDAPAYLKLIEKTINGVARSRGRLKQTVAESSFDAWTKYYRQDENAPNATSRVFPAHDGSHGSATKYWNEIGDGSNRAKCR
jgi:predicted metalloprotease with PDZ domain